VFSFPLLGELILLLFSLIPPVAAEKEDHSDININKLKTPNFSITQTQKLARKNKLSLQGTP